VKKTLYAKIPRFIKTCIKMLNKEITFDPIDVNRFKQLMSLKNPNFSCAAFCLIRLFPNDHEKLALALEARFNNEEIAPNLQEILIKLDQLIN
jgi:hypothetical protein